MALIEGRVLIDLIDGWICDLREFREAAVSKERNMAEDLMNHIGLGRVHGRR